MSCQWETVQDGYDRKLRYVQIATGLIVGHVDGSRYDRSPWYAGTDGPEGHKRLGEYVTEIEAKRAVERAIAERK